MDNIDCDNYDDKPKVFSEPVQPVEKEQKDLIHLTDLKPNCTETKIQMVRRLMGEILEEDVDTFENLFNNMTDTFDNYESIDKEMVKRLKSIFSNDLFKKEKFADIIKAIEQGSTVVYFKSAQLFKVYKKTELETLLGGQIRTIYKQLDESYEIVPNDSKQKIIILGDISLADSIEHIKTYIVSFMISEGLLNFTDNDIVCYKSKDTIEIIINDYYVENRTEHDEVVKKLLKYIFQQGKNTKIVQKINTNPFSEFDGVKMVSMPSNKKLLATEYIEPLLTMISNVTECSKFKNNINLNLTIHNDHSVNNNSINTTNNIIQTDNVDIIQTFIDYILDERPDWYNQGQWMLVGTLYIKFVERCGSSLSKIQFSTRAINNLFSRKAHKVIDSTRGRAVLLFTYEYLENM